MKKIGNRASDLFVDLMAHFCRTQKEIFGFPGGPLHDPCTIVWLIAPDVITLKPMHASIDISRGESYGRTNCDYFSYLNKPQNVRVACETFVTTGLCSIMGEITTKGYIDFQGIARGVIKDIGYTKSEYGFDYYSCGIISAAGTSAIV